jgi:anaerobic magnesium-protoporphyrin IX monomethyl ester cyclase
VHAFCQGVQDLKIDLTWSCFSRVDAVDEDLLVAMKTAGCHQIMYGIESASPTILENIHKKTNLDKAVQAVRAAKKARIDVRAAFMIGNPGETQETMTETLRFALKLDPELIIVNMTTPFPGTDMFAWADANGYLTTKNWNHYDLCHSVMRLPTVSPEETQRFYRTFYRRFYFRPGYVLKRLARLRSVDDVMAAIRGLRGVIGT